MARIDFIDLKAQQSLIREDIERRIKAVLDHGLYIGGPEITELEKKLAEFIGVKHCIACANGTDALMVAMMSLGIGHGDEVITPPFTFFATGEMIAVLGAKPVFVDIDPKSYNIDPGKIQAKITSKTKAIMPVSLYGQCADMDRIKNIAEINNLPVIEDGAQSLGATYKKQMSCGLSDIGCTSFFPSKSLGCYGDGGACFTNDDKLAEKMRWIRSHGQEKRYYHKVLGLNSRLDSIQAAILLSKFTLFPDEIKSRAQIGQRYTEYLSGVVQTPYIESFNTSVYAQYTIEVDNREKVVKALEAKGIPTAVHYPLPLNLQPALSYLGEGPGSYPISDRASMRVLSLPMHPYLKRADQDYVIEAVREALS